MLSKRLLWAIQPKRHSPTCLKKKKSNKVGQILFHLYEVLESVKLICYGRKQVSVYLGRGVGSEREETRGNFLGRGMFCIVIEVWLPGYMHLLKLTPV